MDLIKDKTILQILSHLEKRFGKDSFHIEDYWDADLCAIGLIDLTGRYLLYISSYGKTKDTFHIKLEEKTKGDSVGRTISNFETLTVKELDDLFIRYFLNQRC